MRLSDAEFEGMNSGVRRLFQRRVELPTFSWMGLGELTGKDVVEVGCGNGFGAELLMRYRPRSYVGFDVMPEQIRLAEQRRLPGARFMVGDASAVDLPDACADVLVIFGILHHVEDWPRAVAECRRLLRPGGLLFVEELDGKFIQVWDRFFHWDHPDAGFTLRGLEDRMAATGLNIERHVKLPGVLGVYRARARA